MYKKIKIFGREKYGDTQSCCNYLNDDVEYWINQIEGFGRTRIKILDSELKIEHDSVVIKIDYVEIHRKQLITEKKE